MADNKEFEKELAKIDNDIVQLKRDFEIYFAGASKRPPTDALKRLEQHVKRAGLAQGTSYAQRFRYNSLTARFNSYLDLWTKQLKLKEEGKLLPGGASPPPHAPKAKHPPKTAAQEKPIERIFKEYVSAREQTGEAVSAVTFQKFEKQLNEQRQTLINKFQCKDIEFYVSVEDGKTKLKAKAVK
jgi:hypothetical protein